LSEIGLNYAEMLSCSWKEFEYYERGYQRRIERQWDVARHLIANMYNSSGFAKKKTQARDIMRLEMLDRKPKSETIPKDKVREMLNRL